MTKIICIGYKPNSDDYCRDCHMASYNSDYMIEEYDNIDDVFEWITNIKSRKLLVNEDGYLITIIVNGIIVVKENAPHCYDDWADDSLQELVYKMYVNY